MARARPARGGGRAGSRVFDVLLRLIERGGDALPHPATIFLVLALAVLLASAVASWLGGPAARPGTGEVIRLVNLLTVEGLHRILDTTVINFTSFAPLGTVLVALLGIGVAEGSGLLATFLRLLVLAAPADCSPWWWRWRACCPTPPGRSATYC